MVQLVHRYGPKKWTQIAKHLNGRIGKQCRERWHNHLDPNINKSPWTEEEDRLLAQAHEQYGNQWAKIAKLLPGRYCVENVLLIYGRTNHPSHCVTRPLTLFPIHPYTTPVSFCLISFFLFISPSLERTTPSRIIGTLP